MTAHPTLPMDLREMHARATRYLARRFGALPPCIREELVQDAFLSLFRRAEEETVRRPLGWVLHAVRYRAHVWWRDEGCARRAPVPLPEELADAYRDPLARLAAWQLALLLATAPAHHRQVLDHMYLREGEVEELATAEGITEHAVYQRHAKALDWLRDAAGVPRAPRQVAVQLQATIDQRRAQIVEFFRQAGGWCKTQIARAELQALLKCTRNELSGDLMALKGAGQLEVRGDRKHAEYRLKEST